MAITQNTYTGDNSTVSYSFTFPYLEETDIKVSLDGVDTTAYSLSNATTVTFNTAPGTGVAIRIYRDTNNDALAATFFAGSAIRAQDLNDDFLQNAYVTQEVKNRYLDKSTGGTITGDVDITGDFDVTGASSFTGNVSIDGTLDMNANRILDVGTPTAGTDATNKTYVDTQDALRVAKAGDTMTGNLAMSNNKVTGLGTPSATTDAANKAYVDAYILTVYQGPQASDPTTRTGGSALQEGDLYFNTVEDILKAWTGTEWVISAAAGNIVRWRKTATGGETELSGNDDGGSSLSYVVGNEQVFLNGVLQQRGVDYTASTGTSITGLTALTAGDIVELHAVQGYTSGTVTDGSITSAKIANDTIVNEDVNSAAAIAATKLSFTQSGTGAQTRTVSDKLRDLVSRDDFDTDANFTAAGTAASARLNQIDFFQEGATGYQIVPTDRGLTAKPTSSNVIGTFNAIPNGTPTGTNTAYGVVRAYGQDIDASPTGTRQSLELSTHFDTDSILRARLATRSEGTPSEKHLDVYAQYNGTNCVYYGTKLDGTTGETNIGFRAEGFTFDTGPTTEWTASQTVSVSDERLIPGCDFAFLTCTGAGTTGTSLPTITNIGTSVSDNTATWAVTSKLGAAPAIWMSENGNTGFGTYNPTASYHFANTARFDSFAIFNENVRVNTTDDDTGGNSGTVSIHGPIGDNRALNVYRPATGTSGVVSFYSDQTSTENQIVLFRANGNVETISGSYGTLSDINYKQNVVDAQPQWDDIKSVRFVNYELIDDPDQTRYFGVIAQELEQTSPGLVTTDPEDGKKTVKMSILFAKAVKALQEAQTRIEALEVEISNLKGIN